MSVKDIGVIVVASIYPLFRGASDKLRQRKLRITFRRFISNDNRVYTLMPPKRIFMPQRSRRQNSVDSPAEIQADDKNEAHEDTNEQDDTIDPLTDCNSRERQYQTRRRSSVQIFDLKLLQTLSNQVDNGVSNDPRNVPEGACECESVTIVSRYIFSFPTRRTLK